MNNKLLLSLGLIGSLTLSGCSILSSMTSSEDNNNNMYRERASETLDIAEENLTLLTQTVTPSLTDVTFDLVDNNKNKYRCSIASGLFSNNKPAKCKKKVGNKWESYGTVSEESEDGSSDNSFFHFDIGGENSYANKYDQAYQMQKLHKKPERVGSENAAKNTAKPQVVATSENDTGVVTNEVISSKARNSTPTIIFSPEDEGTAFKTNPTKTYNGRFKMRDEQGHSYECHFANVGQVVSDTVSVCTKLY